MFGPLSVLNYVLCRTLLRSSCFRNDRIYLKWLFAVSEKLTFFLLPSDKKKTASLNVVPLFLTQPDFLYSGKRILVSSHLCIMHF